MYTVDVNVLFFVQLILSWFEGTKLELNQPAHSLKHSVRTSSKTTTKSSLLL